MTLCVILLNVHVKCVRKSIMKWQLHQFLTQKYEKVKKLNINPLSKLAHEQRPQNIRATEKVDMDHKQLPK